MIYVSCIQSQPDLVFMIRCLVSSLARGTTSCSAEPGSPPASRHWGVVLAVKPNRILQITTLHIIDLQRKSFLPPILPATFSLPSPLKPMNPAAPPTASFLY